MTPLQAWSCTGCGRVHFPERLGCPACGGAEFTPVVLAGGAVTEATTARDGTPVATVRTDAGPLVVVRAAGGLLPGDRVALGRAADGAASAVAAGEPGQGSRRRT
jgi:uncharacterized OB-fold protein